MKCVMLASHKGRVRYGHNRMKKKESEGKEEKKRKEI